MAKSDTYERPDAQKTDTYSWSQQNVSGIAFPVDQIDVTVEAAGTMTGYAAGDSGWTDAATGDAIAAGGIPQLKDTVWCIRMADGKVGDDVQGATVVNGYLAQLDSGATVTAGDACYIIPASGEFTHDPTANTLIGHFLDGTTLTSASNVSTRNLKTSENFARIYFDGRAK